MKELNILFVTHEKKMNGASKSMLNLIDEMKNNHTFIVLSKTKDGAVQDELRKRNVRIISTPYYIWERPAARGKFDLKWLKYKITWALFGKLINWYSSRRAKEQLRGTPIDLIHVNTGVISIGPYLKRALGAPLIWHLREFGFEDFGIKPLVSEGEFYGTLGQADGIVAISNAIYNKFKPHLPTSTIERIYNGVGEENINPQKEYYIKKNHKLIILIAGRISSAKGQKIAVAAVQEIVKTGQRNLELWIAGEGDINLLGIKEQDRKFIKILGQVDNLPSLRKNVDLELVCSKAEAFGRVTVEAMMGGIPVIGSNTGGTPELIKDGVNGRLVEYGNVQELSMVIREFYENREEIAIMGKNAYQTAKRTFTISKCAKETEAFYDKIIAASKLNEV